jgi:hypothetical protein
MESLERVFPLEVRGVASRRFKVGNTAGEYTGCGSSPQKIITSWLTKDEIDELHDLVLFNEILDFDYYFEISIGIVTLLLITLACTNYKSISRISRRIYNESLEKARKAKNKQNLRENVKYSTTGKRVTIQ